MEFFSFQLYITTDESGLGSHIKYFSTVEFQKWRLYVQTVRPAHPLTPTK